MSDDYRPNHVPTFDRVNAVLSSCTILIFGSFLLNDQGFVLGKTSGWGWTFPFVTGNLFVFSMLLSVVTLLTKVVDHYDRRNNEVKYQRFAQSCKIISMILFTWGGIGTIFEWQFQNHPPEKSTVEPYTLALFMTGVFVSLVYFSFILVTAISQRKSLKPWTQTPEASL